MEVSNSHIEDNISEDPDIFAVQGTEPQYGKERIRIEFVNQPASITAVKIGNLPTLEDVRKNISDCPDFSTIFSYLKTKMLPQDDDLARKIMLEAENYVIQDDLLYHLFTPRAKKIERAFAIVKQLCIPTGYREVVAMSLHDNNAHRL